MNRVSFVAVGFALWFTFIALWSPATEAKLANVKHVIIIIQENRTPDNLFHGLQKYLPAADIANTGIDSTGHTILLQPVQLGVGFDLGHSHSVFLNTYDNGKMDGADLNRCLSYVQTCPPHAAFHYVEYADVAPYFSIAINYSFANRMFQSNQGSSFAAHQFLLAGTSQPAPNFPLFAAENPVSSGGAGCVAPPGQLVRLIGPDESENNFTYPCFEHQTLTDLLDKPPTHPTQPISWRYYGSPPEGSIWIAPDAIRHICVPGGTPLACLGPHWANGDISLYPPQVLNDIQKGALATVSWVTPSGYDSDHAGVATNSGPSWVSSIINAVGKSAYWKNTVIFVTWDDWGGWYDHVAPPIDPTLGYYEMGFRVPLMVVSPYTPKGYVSQKQHDFGSILHFVETAFDLGRIPPGNFADSRADDLLDFFDFSKPPRTFAPITAKYPSQVFLDPKRPMTAPDDD
jgi:phospholipase C